jgi:MSHA pilin protein MshC
VNQTRGFTLPELIAVLVIASILGAVAAPRLIGSGYNEARLFNETTAALRYARNAALAKQRTVCVAYSTLPTQVKLRYRSTRDAGACDTDLMPPGGGPAPYQVTAQGGAVFSGTFTDFSFDLVGRPSAAQNFSVSGASGSIVVEAETGYVHN